MDAHTRTHIHTHTQHFHYVHMYGLYWLLTLTHTVGTPKHTWMMEEVSKSVELIAPHSELLGKLIFRYIYQ